MSHRMALALSIALTLILAGGVVAARDRFFAAPAGVVQPADTSVATTPRPTAGTLSGDTDAAMREINIAPPQGEEESEPRARDGAARARGDDERVHREFDEDRYEHEDDDEYDD